jgi:hypothetical protein
VSGPPRGRLRRLPFAFVVVIDLDPAVSAAILARVASTCELPVEVVDEPLASTSELAAVFITETTELPVDAAASLFQRRAAVQINRELLVHVLGNLTHFSPGTAPTAGRSSARVALRVPRTGQPAVHEDRYGGWHRIVGNPDEVLVSLQGPIRWEASSTASVVRDDGRFFSAFADGGLVHRIVLRIHVNVLDRAAIIAVQEPPASRRQIKREQPAERLQTVWNRVCLVLIVGIALNRGATLFPGDAKALARDAAVIGFAGAVLVIEGVVSWLSHELRILTIMATAGGGFALADVTLRTVVKITGVGATVTSLGVGVLALVTYLAAQRLASATDALKWPWRYRRLQEQLLDYGPLLLGMSLLLLSVFLQLRSTM